MRAGGLSQIRSASLGFNQTSVFEQNMGLSLRTTASSCLCAHTNTQIYYRRVTFVQHVLQVFLTQTCCERNPACSPKGPPSFASGDHDGIAWCLLAGGGR